jgi:hypothetical protein
MNVTAAKVNLENRPHAQHKQKDQVLCDFENHCAKSRKA